jgi:hypothetical protein
MKKYFLPALPAGLLQDHPLIFLKAAARVVYADPERNRAIVQVSGANNVQMVQHFYH